MRNRYPTRQRRGAAGSSRILAVRTLAAGALALVLALGWSTGSAFAQDDEEDVPLDTKLIRQFLKDLGLRRDGEGIDYRERAPLVVPPSRNLPPPRDSEAAASSNPAWPKDPDAAKRKAEAARKKQPASNKTAAETMIEEGRPVSRAELERGRSTSASSGSQTPEEGARNMRPSELGSKSMFSDLFSTFSDKGETATFTGEPVRDNLTAPPTGYRTPSPSQPYGIAPKNEKKALTVEDRASGETR
jgi:hypothetical protein